jgi:restriction system protein
MARKAPIEQFIELLSALPWWLNLVLAGVVAILLRGIPFLGVVLALVFIIAAIKSGLEQEFRIGLFNNCNTLESLKEMSWQDFEILVGEFYRRQGYSVTQAGGAHPDGGVDLILTAAGKTILVQCKHWKVYKVGVKVVREIYGVMTSENADEAIVITSGYFTPEALDFANAKPIQLIDGKALVRMITEVKDIWVSSKVPNTISANTPPMCPICKTPMVLRTAKHGPHIGSKFWGCRNYPDCKHTEKFNGTA